MHYAETRPGRAAKCVAEFWRFDAGEIEGGVAENFIPPDGLVSVWCSFDRGVPPFAGVTGPSEKAHRTAVRSAQVIVGARLNPGSAAPLLGVDVRKLCGKFIPLADIAPALERPVRDAGEAAVAGDWGLMESLFATLAANAPPPDPVAAGVARRLIETDGGAPIGALADALQLSPRQARRRFEAAIGLSPKSFARVRRVRRALVDALLGETSWTDLSLEAGFADQSHLARNFQSVFNLPPGKVRSHIRRIGHGEVFSA